MMSPWSEKQDEHVRSGTTQGNLTVDRVWASLVSVKNEESQAVICSDICVFKNITDKTQLQVVANTESRWLQQLVASACHKCSNGCYFTATEGRCAFLRQNLCFSQWLATLILYTLPNEIDHMKKTLAMLTSAKNTGCHFANEQP